MKQRKPIPRGKTELKRTELKRAAFKSRASGTPNGPVKTRRPADTGPTQAVKDLVKARAARDAEDGAELCEVCGRKPGTNIHHRQPRGLGGCPLPYINYPSNLLLVCGHGNAFAGCHAHIESDRDVAKDMGWLVPRPVAPAGRPVLRRGVWALLDDDGRFEPVDQRGAGLSGVEERTA